MGTDAAHHGAQMQSDGRHGVVSYATHPQAERDFWRLVNESIRGTARRICDVGGGGRPTLSLERIAQDGLEYLVIDASAEQLERAGGHRRAHTNILDRGRVQQIARERGPFDLVISRWTAEHIPDGRGFHESVRDLLRPGATAVHMCSTLYSLPFLANRMLPDALSRALLFGVHRRQGEKFRPYYSWCRGPSAHQLRRLERTGFAIRFYGGYFGHGFYRPIPPLHRLHGAMCDLLVGHPVPALTSFAVVSLERTD